MELKEFIKATVSDIAQAVKELNEELADTGLVVNPGGLDIPRDTVSLDSSRLVKEIDFQVLVSAHKESGGSFHIQVVGLEMGNQSQAGTVSTIHFAIPVLLPPPPGNGAD